MQGSEPPEKRWLWRGLAALLIVGAAVLHVAYLAGHCPLDLAPDEAHYWDWSRHLDWSYYSKGPLVALIIHGSCSLFGPLSESLTGNLALAIRLPAIGCGMLLLASMYVLTVQALGRERLAFGVVALALTMPPVAALSTLMTIDAPYTACWSWALVFGHAAAVRGKSWAWPIAGLLVGIGILAKYTMVLWLPSVGLFLLTSGAGRVQLRRPGFWLACGIAAVCCLPIVYWNARNDWITVRHVGWQAGVEQREGWRWLGPLGYVGGQAAVLLGFWFAAWVAAMWAYRPTLFGGRCSAFGKPSSTEYRTANTEHTRYLWWLSAPMFGVFLIASFKTTGQLNWPVTAYLSGGVLAAAWLNNRAADPHPRDRRAVRWAVISAGCLGIVLTVFVHFPALGRPMLVALAGAPTPDRPLPARRFDPSCRLRGWPTLAAAVDEAMAGVRARGEEPIVAVGSWTVAGELGVYCANHPTVYSLGIVFGDRSSQYDLWRPSPVFDPEAFRGRTFVMVSCVPHVAWYFDAVDSTRDVVYAESGHPVEIWHLMVARGYRGVGSADDRLKLARH